MLEDFRPQQCLLQPFLSSSKLKIFLSSFAKENSSYVILSLVSSKFHVVVFLQHDAGCRIEPSLPKQPRPASFLEYKELIVVCAWLYKFCF